MNIYTTECIDMTGVKQKISQALKGLKKVSRYP